MRPGRDPRDERVATLVRTLRVTSPHFEALWQSHDVTWRPRSQHKSFLHPEVGVLELDCEELSADGDTQLLLLYSAVPGSPTADKLRLLEITGGQPRGGVDADSPHEPSEAPRPLP